MEPLNEHHLKNRISWGSVIAGLFIVMAVSLLLSVLGTGLGISMMSFQSDDVLSGSHTLVMVWWIVSVMISLVCGAFIAGRLAGYDGMIHGVLVWATSLVIATVLGLISAGSMVGMVGNTIGSIASATGSAAEGIGSVSAKGLKETFGAGSDILKQFNINLDLPNMNLDSKALQALRDTNIPTLQPNYLKSQFEHTKNDAMQALKDIAVSPNDSDRILSDLMNQIKQRSEKINQAINRDDVAKAIASNTSYNAQEARQIVDNFMYYRQQAVDTTNQKIDQLKDKINQAKQDFADFKSKLKEKMDQAAQAVARIAIWCFVGSVLGAIVSALSGFWGVNTYRKTKHYVI